VIFDSHELFPELDTLDPLQAPHWRDIAQRFVPQVDLVLTVSDGIARELRDRYRAVRVEVIDNLAATGGTPSDTVRSRLGLPETEPLIIHVGTVSPQRRPELAVDLLARLPEAHLAFVGEIRGGLEAPLRQRAERLGVAERLHVVDPVPLDELVEFLSDADAGVILSSPERSLNLKLTVPNKLYDYLAAGLPVVATAGLPPADIAVQERVGAAFVDGDVTSLAAAMRTVLGDDELRARARARRSEWTWALHEERLVRLVRQQAEQATLPSVHRDTAAAAAEPQHANNARSAFSARVRKAASWRLRRLAARLEP
jgi:glycosyltransferase involved in cell wall biosynthesis